MYESKIIEYIIKIIVGINVTAQVVSCTSSINWITAKKHSLQAIYINNQGKIIIVLIIIKDF